jgi:hypothetical protein
MSPSKIRLGYKCLPQWNKRAFKNVNNCLLTNIYFYLKTSGGQSSDLYLNVVHFFNTVLIRHLWHLKTFVFLHWCNFNCKLQVEKVLYHCALLLHNLIVSKNECVASCLPFP